MSPERSALERIRRMPEDLPRLRTEMGRRGVPGVLVRYQGSRAELHGRWTVLGMCECGKCRDLRMFGQDPDYLLLGADDGRRLKHVRPESVSGWSDDDATATRAARDEGGNRG